MPNVEKLVENLAAVRGIIGDAARRSGRAADEVTLVAVTKYVGDDVIRALVEGGCRELGESRPQSLWAKAEALAQSLGASPSVPDVRWHLVGHLQRNKVEQTLPFVSLIHSADSLRLSKALDEAAAKQGRRAAVLIEVNVSGDETKHGFLPAELEPLLPSLAALQDVEVRGLMCMAAREGDLDIARRNFAELRALRDRLAKSAPPNVSLAELSMGMSGDYEVAIEEGATIVRIGSALFEGVM
jgi:pyridoxal phosphate enzyme (YggS family)